MDLAVPSISFVCSCVGAPGSKRGPRNRNFDWFPCQPNNIYKPKRNTMDNDDLLDFSSLDAQSSTRVLPSQTLSQSFSQPISSSYSKPKTLSESYQDGKITKAPSRRKTLKKEDDEMDDDDDAQDRKRRDNMNDKIQELLVLLPEEYFSEAKDKSSGTKDGKPNKGQILTKGVEYIQDVQNKIDENNRKEVELVWRLKNLIKAKGVQVNDINLNNTSAEIVLAEIGVGPLAGIQESVQKSPNNNFEYGGYDEYS